MNDDFCDCPEDGSDETTTNACANGHFECDTVHEKLKQTLFSAAVNDGICDCCDGSDEQDPQIKTCENTCGARLEELLKEEMELKARYEQGRKVRAEWIDQAMNEKGKALEQISSLRTKFENLATREEEARQLKEKEEEIETVEKEEEKKRKEEQFRHTIQLPQLSHTELISLLISLLAEGEEKVVEAVATMVTEESGEPVDDATALMIALELAEGYRYKELDDATEELNEQRRALRDVQQQIREAEHDDHHDDHHSDDLLDNEAIMSLEERVKYLQLHIEGLEANEATLREAKQILEKKWMREKKEELEETMSLASVTNTEALRDTVWLLVTEHSLGRRAANILSADLGKDMNLNGIDYPGEHFRHTRKEATDAKSAYRTIKREKEDAEEELKDLEALEDIDFGEEMEYFKLHGECFTFKQEKYEYKFCPFKEAKQDHTLLGKFEKEEWANDKSRMIFNDGKWCMDKNRKAIVLIECGVENEITRVSEPERCEYEIRFRCPAACA